MSIHEYKGKMKSIYICYLSVNEPLVHTQVIPYLQALVSKNIGIVLLTFEPRLLDRQVKQKIRAQLAEIGVVWYDLPYHKFPSLLAKLWDILVGTIYAAMLIKRHQATIVHSRTHVPAAMALVLKKVLGVKILFDVRGLVADEYVDAGHWKRNSLKYKITKYMEQQFFNQADAIVVLTERIKKILHEQGRTQATRVKVIPSCVDVQRFRVDPKLAQARRSEMGLSDRVVLLYAGKFGSWYMAAEMINFFFVARQVFPRLHFLVLTQSDHKLAYREFERCHLSRETYTVMTVPPEKVPLYFAVADAAISFILPSFSKQSSSPTKIGEYLAAGLPIVVNTGIGDCDALLKGHGVAVLLSEFTSQAYRSAADSLRTLLSEKEEARERCCNLADQELSLQKVGVPRYTEVYSFLQGDEAWKS